MEILKILLIVLVVLLLFLLLSKGDERFIDKCLGKRDGVSGCRDCCKQFKNMYAICVSKCMRF